MKGVNELTQVPVLSMRLPEYGHYYVDIGIAVPYDYGNDLNADLFGGAMDRGGEFYFDALRIYDPIDLNAKTEEAAIAYEVYKKPPRTRSAISFWRQTA